jgi:PIN domain
MVIVYDAGPLTADRAFKRRGSRALLRECQEGRIRVAVPRAVFEEVVNATRGWFRTAEKNLGKARHNLDEAFADPPTLGSIDVDALVARYRDELQRTLEAHDVVIGSWDDVTHDEIVDRDLARNPPFDESGRGYRDTLTWHVIRDLVVDEGERVILVTKDNDFSSDEDAAALHPKLVEEIGGDAAAVTIVKDLAEAIRVVGEARDEFRAQLAGRIEGQPHEIGTRVLGFLEEDLLPYGLQSDIGDGWLRDVEVDEVVEAWGVWTGVVYAELEFESEGLSRLYANEFDWNEEQRYATVDGTGVVNVILAVTYDPSDGTLDVEDAHVSEDLTQAEAKAAAE